MMRKYLFFLYLLLLSVQLAIAQTARYEYWLDNDHEGRTIVADNVTDVTLDLDISALKPGMHYFSFRTQSESGQWGGLSRYLFLISEGGDSTSTSMTQYEYWLDNNYEQRTMVKGAVTDIPLSLDISSLKPGMHYFSFRAQGRSGQWGGLSRYLFLISEGGDSTTTSTTQYEYWLDNNYEQRTMVKGAVTDIPLSLDISSLKPGMHYFSFRAQGRSGQWGGLSRYLFFMKQDAIGQLANIEYWIDERQDVMTQQVTDSTVVITMDITNLPVGRHTFNMEGKTPSGYSGLLASYEFVNSELPVLPDPIIAHEGNTITITTTPDSTLADSLVVNPTYYYTLDGSMPDTTSIKYVEPFEVTQNCVVKAIGMQRGFTNSRVDSLVVDWFKVETPTFSFQNMYDDNLTIETETPDAEIYYTMNGRLLEGDDTNFGYNSLSPRYSNWSVWGDNKQEAKVERGGYNDTYCLKLTSETDSVFESAQAGYKFSEALVKDGYYTIRFMARSKSGNGKLQFYCQNDTLPNTRSAADTLTIGSQFADYEVTLKIDNDKTNQLVLNFGAVADTYYIDNVLFGPVISDTTNLLRTRYEYPIELQQGVTIKAVATKQGMKDSEPAVYDYFAEGWRNMLETYDYGSHICKWAIGDPNVPQEIIWDVMKRLEDMFYRYYEQRLTERFDDNEIMAVADEMRHYVNIIEKMMQGFIIDGVSYHAIDSVHAEVVASLDYYTPYRNAITVAKEVHYNDLDFQVTSVAQGAFANSTLAAIVWNPTVALKYEDVAVINNPNLLVYVNEASLAPENVTNLVVNGLAKNIELVDADNNNFYCPQAFTAEAISYTREFRQETQVGVSRGWEAIALPFDVQTIMHEKQGMIAPFGNSASNKHFWLRRLSSNGLVSADKMEANVPYIISMPNSDAYPAGFNLPGRVTFSSANVTVPVTESRTLALADSTIMMASTMQRLGRSSSYYALNVGETRGQYYEGSVFERDYREVRPFEAYTIHRSDTPAPRFVPVNALMGGTTGIEDVIELMSDDRGEGTWHDLQGRKVANGKLPRGVYIRNGRKVVIR